MSDVVDILKKVGALISDDHFVLTSGKHTDVYINKDALYPHTKEAFQVGKMIAEKFKDKNIQVVVGPALAGIVLSQWTAHHLSKLTGKEVLGVYAEKDHNNNQVFRRGYDRLVRGKRVLIVEDVTTTGGSVKKVINIVKQAKGKIVGVCVLTNRDPALVSSKSLGVPFTSLSVFKATSFDKDQCPFCKQGRKINTQVGHGKKFLSKPL